MNEVLTYEALKAERDAQQKRADALAVENAALKSSVDLIASAYTEGEPVGFEIDRARHIETPATDEALAAIEARGVEKFVTKIAKQLREAGGERGYNLVDWCEYAEHLEDRGEKFAIELREAK